MRRVSKGEGEWRDCRGVARLGCTWWLRGHVFARGVAIARGSGRYRQFEAGCCERSEERRSCGGGAAGKGCCGGFVERFEGRDLGFVNGCGFDRFV